MWLFLAVRWAYVYDPYFWWHERYWKLMAPLAGIRVGRRLFDDGVPLGQGSQLLPDSFPVQGGACPLTRWGGKPRSPDVMLRPG
jgi:hypothetical protein